MQPVAQAVNLISEKQTIQLSKRGKQSPYLVQVAMSPSEGRVVGGGSLEAQIVRPLFFEVASPVLLEEASLPRCWRRRRRPEEDTTAMLGEQRRRVTFAGAEPRR